MLKKSYPAVNPNIKLPIEMYLIDVVNNSLTGKKGLRHLNSILQKNKDMINVEIPIKYFSINDKFILLE